MESLHFGFARPVDNPSSIEIELVFEETSDEECLAHTTAAIKRDKLAPPLLKIIVQLAQLRFSSDNLFHLIFLLLNPTTKVQTFSNQNAKAGKNLQKTEVFARFRKRLLIKMLKENHI